jgi:hypothetical protein
MARRVLTTALWFLMIWVGYEIALAFIDWPRFVGPIVAALIASAVYLDPAHLLWPHDRGAPAKTVRAITGPPLIE